MICSKFAIFAVEMTTGWLAFNQKGLVVICSKFAIFAVEMTTRWRAASFSASCDLLKIRYLCGRNDNAVVGCWHGGEVVICSKFAIFAVEMTTAQEKRDKRDRL